MREGFQSELEMDDQILALRCALQKVVTDRPELATKSKNVVRSSSKRGRRREDSASSSTSTKRSSSTSTTQSSTRSSQNGRRGRRPKSYGVRKARGKKQSTPLRNTNTKQTRSKKQKMRKREWDKTRCPKEIAEGDMDFKALQSIQLHVKPSVPTVLQGDVLSQPISPYLLMLLSLGGKCVPHSFPGPSIKRSLKALASEAMEMRRVLLWSLAFTKEPKKVDIYRSFPHPSLFRKSGRDPPPCVLPKFGAESFVIQNFVNKCHDTFKFRLSDFAEQRPPSRGVIWHGGCVHDLLKTHIIVAADKDGAQIVMSLKTYLMEQNNNMGAVHKNGEPEYGKLGDFTTDQELM